MAHTILCERYFGISMDAPSDIVLVCSWGLGFATDLKPRWLGLGDGLHLALLRLGLGFDSLGNRELDGRSSDHLGLGGNFLHVLGGLLLASGSVVETELWQF